MKGSSVKLAAQDGQQLGAYLARPVQPPTAAVVVLQEVFGVNAHIRSLCDRYAAEGYLAIAPALYDRVEPGIELPYGPEGVARGREIRKLVPDATAMLDVEAAVRHVAGLGIGRIAVVGFCWGGTLAWLAAARLPVVAAVAYYGSGIATYLHEPPKVPVMLHFGDKDAHIPLTDVQKIRAAFPQVPIHLYDATHGFNCDDRAAYHAPSAGRANDRTLQFLAEHLAGEHSGRPAG